MLFGKKIMNAATAALSKEEDTMKLCTETYSVFPLKIIIRKLL